jgi:hypothetical protein
VVPFQPVGSVFSSRRDNGWWWSVVAEVVVKKVKFSFVVVFTLARLKGPRSHSSFEPVHYFCSFAKAQVFFLDGYRKDHSYYSVSMGRNVSSLLVISSPTAPFQELFRMEE